MLRAPLPSRASASACHTDPVDVDTTGTMAEREDNVYKAKLAEQAERYDGKKRGGGKENQEP